MSSWSFTIRLSNGERLPVEVNSTATVQQCKDKIASLKAELQPSRQRLVYKGRILDDNDRQLSDYGIIDKSTLFLVMSSTTSTSINRGPSSAATTTTVSPAASTTPSPFNPWGGASPSESSSTGASNPFAAMGMGGAGGLPNLNNPPSADQMQAMMNSPMMQSMMDNPEMMRAAMQMSMQQNPQLRALMESNPEMRQMMEDPAMLDQAIQMMRNPAYMQQQMRNQELAMSQLENLPGGFNALSSMYRNYQEPLMDAQVDGSTSNATAANNNSSSSADGATGAAMPNPWGSPSASSTSNSGASSGNNTSSSSSNIMPSPWGMPLATAAGSASSGANPWGAAMGASGGLPSMPPGMMNPQNMDPNQLMSILDNPMVTQMMQQMVDQNPDMVRQMVEAQNPMLRQVFQSNPEMGNQMVRQMMNPEALRAMVQMQQAMGGAGAGAAMGFPPPPGNTAGAGSGGGLDFSSLLSGGATGVAASGGQPGNPMDFTNMMQQLQSMPGFGGMPGTMGGPAATPSNQHPADRFRSQLQSLRDMGFDDEQQCLTVLQQNHGNLNRAVDALLAGPPPSAPAVVAPGDNTSSGNDPNTTDPANETAAEPKDATEKKND